MALAVTQSRGVLGAAGMHDGLAAMQSRVCCVRQGCTVMALAITQSRRVFGAMTQAAKQPSQLLLCRHFAQYLHCPVP